MLKQWKALVNQALWFSPRFFYLQFIQLYIAFFQFFVSCFPENTLAFSLLFPLPPLLCLHGLHTPSQPSHPTPRVANHHLSSQHQIIQYELDPVSVKSMQPEKPWMCKKESCMLGLLQLLNGKHDCWWKLWACLCLAIRLVCELSFSCIEFYISKCWRIKIILKIQNIPYSQKDGWLSARYI